MCLPVTRKSNFGSLVSYSVIHQIGFWQLFYYNVLRGGEEHRNLKLSQLSFHNLPDPEKQGQLISCVEHTKHGSKNCPGG